MLVIGHRGCAAQYLENTLAAVRRCRDHVDMVEIDVQRCGSGELVAFHDETLDRVTDAAEVVSETDWKRLRELEILDSGEPIPKLDDLIEAWPADTGLNLDIRHAGVASDALDLVSELPEMILFSTDNGDALDEGLAADVNALIGYSFYGRHRPKHRVRGRSRL